MFIHKKKRVPYKIVEETIDPHELKVQIRKKNCIIIQQLIQRSNVNLDDETMEKQWKIWYKEIQINQINKRLKKRWKNKNY
ncbi:unnamed protein product [Paramecium sonneborni]|uniref:Uncharacterized protein n=1 Tax=Paramecium sonneborni TaxID=65129 RepID=A0A8S1KX89_9CILI|nr:unnamed protein product [Paramecium sonneborni]